MVTLPRSLAARVPACEFFMRPLLGAQLNDIQAGL